MNLVTSHASTWAVLSTLPEEDIEGNSPLPTTADDGGEVVQQKGTRVCLVLPQCIPVMNMHPGPSGENLLLLTGRSRVKMSIAGEVHC